MANTLLTPSMITKENLRVLHQGLNFVSKVNRQYDDRFAVSGAKIGTTLNIRKPARYTVSTGASLSTQDSTDTQVALAVTTQKHVDITFSSAELTMSVDSFSERYIKPAMSVLAASIEADALSMYKQVYQQAGSVSSPITGIRPFLLAQKYMKNSLTPDDGYRNVILNTDTNVEMVDGLKGLFNSTAEIGRQYEEGLIGKNAGYKYYENTLIPAHTPGAQGGTPLVNGATQTGSSLVTDGWSNSITGVLKEGDIITLAGVYAVHPETKQSFGYLQQFVVTADANSNGSGQATLSISPEIVTSGAFQNVSGSPADNAAITVIGTASTAYGINLAFHKDAFTFATADLEDMSQYGAWGAREVFEGISLRTVSQYLISSDTRPTRIDVLYGYKSLYPQLAARVANLVSPV